MNGKERVEGRTGDWWERT